MGRGGRVSGFKRLVRAKRRRMSRKRTFNVGAGRRGRRGLSNRTSRVGVDESPRKRKSSGKIRRIFQRGLVRFAGKYSELGKLVPVLMAGVVNDASGGKKGSGIPHIVVDGIGYSLLDFDGKMINIGRSWAMDIAVNHPSISRRHARIYVGDNGCRIKDVDSNYGTSVLRDGKEISANFGYVVLQSGDVIKLGNFEFRFEIVNEGKDYNWSDGVIRSDRKVKIGYGDIESENGRRVSLEVSEMAAQFRPAVSERINQIKFGVVPKEIGLTQLFELTTNRNEMIDSPFGTVWFSPIGRKGKLELHKGLGTNVQIDGKSVEGRKHTLVDGMRLSINDRVYWFKAGVFRGRITTAK